MTDVRVAAAGSGIAEQWREMVTAALLGTDRRDPPPPAAGVLADLAADDPRGSPSQRLLQQAAASTVLRRAGVRAAPPCAPFTTPEEDPRPLTATGGDAHVAAGRR